MERIARFRFADGAPFGSTLSWPLTPWLPTVRELHAGGFKGALNGGKIVGARYPLTTFEADDGISRESRRVSESTRATSGLWRQAIPATSFQRQKRVAFRSKRSMCIAAGINSRPLTHAPTIAPIRGLSQ